jgi:hypothetical protein
MRSSWKYRYSSGHQQGLAGPTGIGPNRCTDKARPSKYSRDPYTEEINEIKLSLGGVAGDINKTKLNIKGIAGAINKI